MRTNPCLELTLRKAPLLYDHEEKKRRKKQTQNSTPYTITVKYIPAI